VSRSVEIQAAPAGDLAPDARTPAEWAAYFLRPGTLNLQEQPPLSLYVHLPWCLKKCPYCDFNSHGKPDELPQAAYLAALRADLEASLPLIWGRHVVSVFIGGGTPSLFSPDAIAELLQDIRARVHLVPACEITLEANPGTFERDRFAGYRQAGVNRLSVGVQSFNDRHLKTLGRVHDAKQARAAVEEVARHFDTFNIDLMYALPGQSLAELQQDLDVALAFQPPHLSIYHLTVEPNTVFASQTPADLPDADLASDMLDLIEATTALKGLERYEVSAFARPGHRCVHNRQYWNFGDYLGIGAGAHGKLSFPHRVVRQVRWREPRTYMEQALAGSAVSNQHEVKRRDLAFEYVMNATRLRDGFDLAEFSRRTGLPPSALQPGLDQALARGWLAASQTEADLPGGPPATRLQPTAKGFDWLSDLQALFLPD
jgi:putative oxygen-independent coproporphyrinogen III oxidase